MFWKSLWSSLELSDEDVHSQRWSGQFLLTWGASGDSMSSVVWLEQRATEPIHICLSLLKRD
jgi:hypothetical protein